jgi:hypothetical protein
MGAIAVSPTEERRIARLAKKLGMRSKAGVVRLALAELDRQVERREVGKAIQDYVRRYGALDRRENASISPAGVARDEA